MSDTMDAALGRWPELLQSLANLSPDQLTDQHQPCPACGGTDRYRWDRDDGPGGWFCNQCGGKDHAGGAGSGMDLLTRVTGWDFKQACRRIEQHLGIGPGGGAPAAAPAPRPAAKPKGRPHRIPLQPPPGTPPPALGSAVDQFPYYDSDLENPCYWIQRVPQPAKAEGGKPGKLFVHRTWLDGRWHYPSKKDGFKSEWPAPRPVYRLPDLIERPDAPVLISEGEGKTSAATQLFPDYVCIAWTGGTAGVAHTNWQHLKGRSVTLWPDADEKGRACMAKLAQILLPIAAAVRVVDPPGHVPQGWDLANALAEKWNPTIAAESLARRVKLVEPPPPAPEPAGKPEPEPKADATPAGPLPVATDYFTCLGYDDAGNRWYQPHDSGQVVRLGRAAHTSTHLVSIVSHLGYWEALYPSKTGINWTAAAASLFAKQNAVGMFDPDCIRGRGAWWEAGQPLLHLGDRLIVDGASQPLKRNGSRFHYQRLTALEGPGDAEPLTDQEAAQVWHLAERFHWDVPASGQLVAGWVVLAPLCGALRWRPHIWLTAAAGSGKSTLMERFVSALLGDMAIIPMGNSSEAGIRQKLRCDALPVVMDESEANERQDQQRIQSILTLARVASSESRASTFKGSPGGDVSSFRVRSMFFLASIATGLKQGADRRRFAQLTLRNPSDLSDEARAAHWQALDRDLEAICTPEFARRLLARSMRLIPVIKASISVLTAVGARVLGSQALGDQYGTLLAGAWHLLSSEPISEQQAEELLSASDWAPYQQELEIPDERRLLNRILQHQLRLEIDRGATTRTVLELVMTCHHQLDTDNPDNPVAPKAAAAVLSRHGLKVYEGQLLISNSAEALGRILADTAWANNWGPVLLRLPNASKMAPQHFAGIGVSRSASVPIDGL